jgi:hypothetical protein
MSERVLVIAAPHFVAGVCLNAEDVAVRSAPILRYMVGWDLPRIAEYVARKGWTWQAAEKGEKP